MSTLQGMVYRRRSVSTVQQQQERREVGAVLGDAHGCACGARLSRYAQAQSRGGARAGRAAAATAAAVLHAGAAHCFLA